MSRYLIRLALIANALFFVFPVIPGLQFHGNFVHALGAGAIFAFVGSFVESVAIAISSVLTVGTLGTALFILIPAWVLGFWLLPLLVLSLVADMTPGLLSFTSWVPASWAGLVLLLIGIATSSLVQRRADKTPATVTAASSPQ